MSVLYEEYGIQVIYHYTESGQGKGPCDGIGAGRLDNLLLGGKVNNAYQAYLTLVHHQSDNLHQKVKRSSSCPARGFSSLRVPNGSNLPSHYKEPNHSI